MKTATETEAVLSLEEVRKILKVCSPDGVLVGGQALAFWADRYHIQRPELLIPAVTADVDFIGDSALAKRLARELGWKSWIPGLDDVTPQTGKVTKKLADGSVKQADFLSGVVGLTTRDVVRRAIELDVPKIGRLRVMHPLDVLDSRIQNLYLLAMKRNPAGIAQAKLAVPVVSCFIREFIRAEGERPALKLLERLAALAEEPGAIRVYLLYGIDPLDAVPTDDFRTTALLHTKRWPQILKNVGAQRKRARRLLSRL